MFWVRTSAGWLNVPYLASVDDLDDPPGGMRVVQSSGFVRELSGPDADELRRVLGQVCARRRDSGAGPESAEITDQCAGRVRTEGSDAG